MEMNERKNFQWKQFLKNLAIIGVPVALQNLLATTASMVDTMMIAQLGETTVGAIGLCAQFSSLMFSGYWGFVGGGMLFFAQYWGAQDDDGIDRSYGMTLACMMIAAMFFACLAAFAPEWVMRIYTDKSSIRQIGVRYLQIVGFAYPLQVLAAGMSALLRSTERVRIPLYAAISSLLTNLALNWILIYGRFGAPAMGVQGAAIATLVSAVVNVAVIFIMARIQKYPYLFHFRRHFCWDVAHLKEYFLKCLPILCNEVMIGIGNMVINVVLGRQSEQAIAAIAVFRTLEGFVVGFWAGFSNAASVLVGKCVGSGELELAYERAKRLVYLCAVCILAVCLILLALHRPILQAMSLSGESLWIGSRLLMIYAFFAVVRMCNWVQNDTYRSAGDPTIGTVLEITFMYLLLLPCVCLSGLVFKAPFLVVFACCYIDEPIRFILMQRHMYSAKWIKPVTEAGEAALPAFQAKHKKQRTTE